MFQQPTAQLIIHRTKQSQGRAKKVAQPGNYFQTNNASAADTKGSTEQFARTASQVRETGGGSSISQAIKAGWFAADVNQPR